MPEVGAIHSLSVTISIRSFSYICRCAFARMLFSKNSYFVFSSTKCISWWVSQLPKIISSRQFISIYILFIFVLLLEWILLLLLKFSNRRPSVCIAQPKLSGGMRPLLLSSPPFYGSADKPIQLTTIKWMNNNYYSLLCESHADLSKKNNILII